MEEGRTKRRIDSLLYLALIEAPGAEAFSGPPHGTCESHSLKWKGGVEAILAAACHPPVQSSLE